MQIEQQVCSLELAKKLKSLGCKQDSLFWYDESEKLFYYKNDYKPSVKIISKIISAFTVAELGEMLPVHFDNNQSKQRFDIRTSKVGMNEYPKAQTFYCSGYDEISRNYVHLDDITEANARAKMLIYLLENKLLRNKIYD